MGPEMFNIHIVVLNPMKKPILLLALVIFILLILSSSGCINNKKKSSSEPSDSDGDGIPDYEDSNPFIPEWGLNLTYLDDTSVNDGEWKVRINAQTDYGVLLVDNTGILEDTIELEIISQPEGWSCSLEKGSVAIDNATVEPVTVTFSVASGASGEQPVVIEGRCKSALTDVRMNITIICVVESTTSQVTQKGDKCTVDYTLWLDDGSQIDSGTLPATAGERYVGPLKNLGYITGFYMGLIGMEKPGGLFGLLGTGETKRIRVPPELGYGTDPDGHELGGEYLTFEIVLRSST